MLVLEPITSEPPRSIRRAVFFQEWLDLTFLHWAVDPELVAPLLPRGTVPDLFDGATWVGLVPFTMSGVRIFGTPPLPYLSRFLETNVRLYACDESGRRGVVFRSLETSRLLPVLAARLSYHLPYLWARMSLEQTATTRTYRTSRRWPGPAGAGGVIQVEIGERLIAGPLEDFLTGRWGLFSTWYGGQTAWAPVDHPPWTLYQARLLDLKDDLISAGGLTTTGAPHVMWTPGVPVRIGRPQRLVLKSSSP